MVERVRPVTYRIPLARKPPTSPQKLISLVTPAGRRRHGIVNDPKNIWTQLKMEKELQPRCHRSYVSADAGLKIAPLERRVGFRLRDRSRCRLGLNGSLLRLRVWKWEIPRWEFLDRGRRLNEDLS